MTYRVLWVKAAEDKLAQLWLGSRHRQAMTTVADRFETLLAIDPTSIGESRNPGFRVALEWPVGFAFFVDEPTCAMPVLSRLSKL